MGHTSYSVSNAHSNRSAKFTYSKTLDENFVQNTLKRIHESMNPKGAKLRESRDSAAHPTTLPIILVLDVTGSMREIPSFLIKDGLPKMMGKINQKGLKDAALLFLAIGDTEYDSAPLQVGQFESGDEELDTWLERTWLEGGGGGNSGESYLLSWYFAAFHTASDAWDKRKTKGFLFTVGDEPSLKSLPANALREVTGVPSQKGYSDVELLKLAQEKYHVYHIHVMEGSAGRSSLGYWKEMLGDNCIQADHHTEIANIIADITTKNSDVSLIVSERPSESPASHVENML